MFYNTKLEWKGKKKYKSKRECFRLKTKKSDWPKLKGIM
jgi:hypothetical protein